jgi:hypothetical protein
VSSYVSKSGEIAGGHRPRPTGDERMAAWGMKPEPGVYRGPGQATSYTVPCSHRGDPMNKKGK